MDVFEWKQCYSCDEIVNSAELKQMFLILIHKTKTMFPDYFFKGIIVDTYFGV